MADEQVATMLSDDQVAANAEARMAKIGLADVSDAEIESEDKGIDTSDTPKTTVTSPVPTPESPAATIPPITPKSETVSSSSVSTDTSTLPENYRRAAIHQGWTSDEITTFMKQSPQQAVRTFEQIYNTTNNLSNQFASLGRAVLKVVPGSPEPSTAESTPSLPDQFNGIDLKSLRDHYGDDDPVVKVLAQVIDQTIKIDRRSQTAASATPDQSAARRAELANIGQQIERFFGDKTLMADQGFYGIGVAWNATTPGQLANRNAVCTLADQIIAGAALQGTSLPNDKALEMAHLAVTAPIMAQQIRQGITNTLQKRENNVSIVPGSSLPVDENKSTKLTDADINARAAERLRKTFH